MLCRPRPRMYRRGEGLPPTSERAFLLRKVSIDINRRSRSPRRRARRLDSVEGRLLRMVVAVETAILGDLPDAASLRHLE